MYSCCRTQRPFLILPCRARKRNPRSRSRASACSASLGSVGVTGVGSTVGGAGSMTGASGSVLPAQPASRHSAASSAKILRFIVYFPHLFARCVLLFAAFRGSFPDFTMPRAQTQPAFPLCRASELLPPIRHQKPPSFDGGFWLCVVCIFRREKITSGIT